MVSWQSHSEIYVSQGRITTLRSIDKTNTRFNFFVNHTSIVFESPFGAFYKIILNLDVYCSLFFFIGAGTAYLVQETVPFQLVEFLQRSLQM
jgi:hypothetical protein